MTLVQRLTSCVNSHNDSSIGYCIFLNENHRLEFALGVGQGSNSKAELLGLWAVLHSSQMMGIPLARIFGGSQVIINWQKVFLHFLHQSSFNGVGNLKSFLKASKISPSFTSIENSMGLQIVFPNKHSCIPLDLGGFSNFWMTNWSIVTLISFSKSVLGYFPYLSRYTLYV